MPISIKAPTWKPQLLIFPLWLPRMKLRQSFHQPLLSMEHLQDNFLVRLGSGCSGSVEIKYFLSRKMIMLNSSLNIDLRLTLSDFAASHEGNIDGIGSRDGHKRNQPSEDRRHSFSESIQPQRSSWIKKWNYVLQLVPHAYTGLGGGGVTKMHANACMGRRGVGRGRACTPYVYRLPSISKHCPSICDISSHSSRTNVCCYCSEKRMLHAKSSDHESLNIWLQDHAASGW